MPSQFLVIVGLGQFSFLERLDDVMLGGSQVWVLVWVDAFHRLLGNCYASQSE